MPYIKQDKRNLYDHNIDALYYTLEHTEAREAAGDFTYIIYRLLKRFSGKYWMRALGIGCLVCAILEMYRVDHAKYEDKKIAENGDVNGKNMGRD